jgi:hypothetical protein
MKNLYKLFNKTDLPWVHLLWYQYYSNGKIPGQTLKGSYWRSCKLRLTTLYKGISHVQAGSGETILFWKDKWNGKILHLTYPHLFSFADDENISLHSVMIQDSLQDIFNLPLFEEAFEKFCEIDIPIQSI